MEPILIVALVIAAFIVFTLVAKVLRFAFKIALLAGIALAIAFSLQFAGLV